MKNRAWTVYFANTQLKKDLKIQWGLNPLNLPLWVRQWLISTDSARSAVPGHSPLPVRLHETVYQTQSGSERH